MSKMQASDNVKREAMPDAVSGSEGTALSFGRRGGGQTALTVTAAIFACVRF
jgi:hypothetical protein